MKVIEFKEEDYLGNLVFMLMGLDHFKIEFKTLFLVELIKESEGGWIDVEGEKKVLIMERMGIKKGYYQKLLSRLEIAGHIRKDGRIVYLAPKYRAVKESEGNFLIRKKSLGV